MSAYTVLSHTRIHHSYVQSPWFVPIHLDEVFLAAGLFKLCTAIALNQKYFLISVGDLHLLEKAWRIFINKMGAWGGETKQVCYLCMLFSIVSHLNKSASRDLQSKTHRSLLSFLK